MKLLLCSSSIHFIIVAIFIASFLAFLHKQVGQNGCLHVNIFQTLCLSKSLSAIKSITLAHSCISIDLLKPTRPVIIFSNSLLFNFFVLLLSIVFNFKDIIKFSFSLFYIFFLLFLFKSIYIY